MKILLDTSVIVEIDRGNEKVVRLLKRLREQEEDLLVNSITVTETLLGPFLCRNVKEATFKVKEILEQFIRKDIDGETAETAATLFAYLTKENKKDWVEYPDVLIAATFFATRCDALLTLNKKDFLIFPGLKNKVFTPEEFEKQMK